MTLNIPDKNKKLFIFSPQQHIVHAISGNRRRNTNAILQGDCDYGNVSGNR
jgi:hypothetical protein